MSRGKPAPDQLDLSMKMMEILAGDADLKCETGVDCRNYGVIDGIDVYKRQIQRDVFADYLDHAAERVVEELINRAVGDFEMDQEDRHLISRYYKCVFVGCLLYTSRCV